MNTKPSTTTQLRRAAHLKAARNIHARLLAAASAVPVDAEHEHEFTLRIDAAKMVGRRVSELLTGRGGL